MASITDCVVEGLKYPFTDIKKVFGLGVLFTIVELLLMALTIRSVDVTRTVIDTVEHNANLTASGMNASMLSSGDTFLGVAMMIIAFVAALFIMGYQYNVIDFSINKKDDLPGFADILGMFIRGIKYFAVSLVYGIPVVLVMMLGILVSVFNSSLFVVVMMISLLFAFICYLLWIMALNNMVAHNSIKKAFDLSEIIGNIANLGWGKYIGTVLFTVIVFVIINMAVGVVLSILSAAFAAAINNQAIVISVVIGVIEAFFVSSYLTVFFSRVCGSIYRESIK
ncbi:DUF4013 domain-containing protein [Methanobrevibacter sp.]|uniref:DUF4013 domain-containing protein n=1 Tax=Methanobrevibacter sp. TaxID=66852 RepID=UPI003863B2FA